MLIGLCGRAGCGKSTVARFLADRFDFEVVRFAGPLKDMLRTLGLTDHQVDGHLKETPCELLGGRTPRWAMQSLGTEWGRKLIDTDLWVRAWAARIPRTGPVVTDDVRFANEAAKIREFNGRVIEILRPGETITGDHESERRDFLPDETITNDASLADLYAKLETRFGS